MDVQFATFVVAVALLLATPGPTNTLLTLSGVTVGFRRSTPLVIAEVLGYTISVSVLYFILRPLAATAPMVDLTLRAACGVYLAYAAFALWCKGSSTTRGVATVTFQRLFVATLLNPKGGVIAFLLMPLATTTPHHYFAAVWGLILIAGTAWISAGAAFGGAAPRTAGIACRAGALALFAFSSLALASAAANPLLLGLGS